MKGGKAIINILTFWQEKCLFDQLRKKVFESGKKTISVGMRGMLIKKNF